MCPAGAFRLLPRLVSLMCPPCARPSALTVVGDGPPCVWNVSSMCLQCVRHVPALCQRKSGLGLGLTSGLCPLLPCCGAEPWHHQVKFFLTIAQPPAFILHARWSLSLAFILVPQIRPLQAHSMLQKLFEVYAGIICIACAHGTVCG